MDSVHVGVAKTASAHAAPALLLQNWTLGASIVATAANVAFWQLYDIIGLDHQILTASKAHRH
jgi:hypothetical protein